MALDNKKIAINTIYLYIRMIANMLISLYTSRVVLQTLGVEDFGIYNLVGGVVVLFSFLNNAMTNGIQRFINVEIASRSKSKVRDVFCTSINVQILVSLIVLLLAETVGLWFLNSKLNIPTDRMLAANYAYQFSIFVTFVGILRIPYNAMIIAQERMSFYAFLSIIESLLKLVIVYFLLLLSAYDTLILYSWFLLIVAILLLIVYVFYCRQYFKEETKYVFIRNKDLYKRILGFSGWNLFGQVSVLGSTQGVNMLLNIFYGVVINAGIGIANQINGIIYNFISNLQIAFNPQIVQTYAEKKIEEHKKLILNSSQFSFYLVVILAMPIVINLELLLGLWLSNVPQYTKLFSVVVICSSIINAISAPFWMSANAMGNIRKYQIRLSLILLINLPITYFVLWFDLSLYYVVFFQILLNFVSLLYRFFYVNEKLCFNKREVFTYVKPLIYVCLYCLCVFILSRMVNLDFIAYALLYSILMEVLLFLLIYRLGLSDSSRIMIRKKVLGFLKVRNGI
ncbi:lipopolysaccharide biosynthesis protein [Myroides odoratimimus]|uniref:lipopolysaccharide biosynthesis protein n=1 Tax=Myroides odoratimimus TaxID=76832 RepID=UPI002576312D|nr:lipopolysaccharide biosynthesis protein [Myroides odoratimimus]MDM1521193.1 lipopolysaccharide biosynthesis protein [Myroides odoratimimus]